MTAVHSRSVALAKLGVILVTLSVILNKWSVQAFATSDGQIESALYVLIIVGMQMLLGVVGLILLQARRYPFWLCTGLLGFVAYLWLATFKPTNEFSNFFLSYAPGTFLANTVLSALAIFGYLLAVNWDKRRNTILNATVSFLAVGFMALVFELPALIGLVDYRQVFIPKGVGFAGPHNRIYEPSGFFHRPANDSFDEVRPGDSVVTLGVQTDRQYSATYTYDQNGFRNSREIENPDLLLVGDSFIEGYKVNQDEAVTERIMAVSAMSAVSVAQSDYSLYHGLSALKHFMGQYQPKVVVWFVFEGNDLPFFNLSHDEFVDRNASKAGSSRFGERSFFGNVSSILATWSSIFVRNWWQGEFARTRSGHFRDTDWTPETAMYFEFGPPENHDAGMPRLKDLLLIGDALVRENGGKMLVAYIPIKIDVYRDLMIFPEDSKVADWADLGLAAELATWSEESGVTFLDLNPALRRNANEGVPVYYLDDAHWSPEGHDVIARTVTEHLTEIGWIE